MSSSVNKIPRFHSVRKYGTLALAATVLSAGLAAFDAPATTAAQATANDSFARTTSNNWGTATSGGSYSTWHSPNIKMFVNNGQARVTGLGAGGSSVATLKSVTSTDVAAQGDITFTKLPSSKTTVYTALEVRRQSDDSSYRGRLIGKTDSNATLQLSRTNKGKETHLASFSLPFKVKAGEQVRLEINATGTTQVELSARAWVVGQKTPAWQLSKTDKSSGRIKASGNFGFWAFASGYNPGAVDLAVDNLSLAPATASQPELTAPETNKPEAITPPVSNNSRGAGSLGSANYAVPSNAIYVANNASGTQSGTKAAPFGSLQKAIDSAKSGQTIVLRAGTYHQSAEVPYGKDNLTIQNYPGEKVWMDGTKAVTNWKKSGSTWVASGWTPSFSNKLLNVANNTRFVDPKNPMAAHPDMLFVNGKQLKQVANAASVVPGTFAVNHSTDQLILGDDPTNKSVTASALGQALTVVGKNGTVQGFGIRGYATEYDSMRAALQMVKEGATVKNMHISENAMMGLAIQNNDSTVDRVSSTGNGMLGIAVNAAYGFELKNSIASGNNTEKFKAQPVAGGVKITRTRGLNVSNLEVNNNGGMGLWLDESVYDFTITGVTAKSNTAAGIEAEISNKGIIANNESTGNKIGLLLFDTSNVKVYNNNLGGNQQMGLQISQDARRQYDKSFAGQDPRRPIPDPTMTWITKNIDIINNVFDSTGTFQVYALDKETRIPVDNMNVVIRGNLFSARPNTSHPSMVAWGGSDNKTLYRYDTPNSLSQAKNSAWKNTQTSTPKSMNQMDSDLKTAATNAVSIPRDVAAVTGLPEGAKLVGRQ